MKIAQQYPKNIRHVLTKIKEQDLIFNYETDVSTLLDTLFEMVNNQQRIIEQMLKQQYQAIEVPINPAGVYAVPFDFEQWFTCSSEIITDMKEGEIVIVRKSSQEHYEEDFALKWMTVNHMQYEHDDKEIYVATTDSPTCTNWFQKYDGTIGNKIKIINNFIKQGE
mgnify:CR=1 FL=1|tara:strand:- start:5431 stop:5928 length:498 start_codon:yes stop_codon:yes gene_type:complete